MDADLTDAQLDELRAALEALQAALPGLIAGAKERSRTVDLDQPIGRLTRMDAMQQRAMAQEECRRHEIRKLQIGAAMLALDAGTYGECRSCGEPIGYVRLAARPESPMCMPCMRSREQR